MEKEKKCFKGTILEFMTLPLSEQKSFSLVYYANVFAASQEEQEWFVEHVTGFSLGIFNNKQGGVND